MLREGKGMGNLRLVIPGIPGIPGNHIKSKVKFNILFIFMPWPAIRKTANNDSISRLNSRPKLPFPGNGKGNYKMPREGKGREIWGLYTRESWEMGIPAHPWFSACIKMWAQQASPRLVTDKRVYFSTFACILTVATLLLGFAKWSHFCQSCSLFWILSIVWFSDEG